MSTTSNRNKNKKKLRTSPVSPPRSTSSSSSSSSLQSSSSIPESWELKKCAVLTKGGSECKNNVWKDHPCCKIHYSSNLSKIPSAVFGLIGAFQDTKSRVATNKTSKQLRQTLEAGCPPEACLAKKKVRKSCVGVCEQRGARRIQEAVKLDPRVLRRFTFESSENPELIADLFAN